MLFLLHKNKQEAQFLRFKREVKHTLGSEKIDDFASKNEFEKFVNNQINVFENSWRKGVFRTSKSTIDPQFIPSKGMEWTASSYIRKCNEVFREPIPEILEDFEDIEKEAKASLDDDISMLNEQMEKSIKDIYQRIVNGEKRTKILEDYQGQFAKPQNKVVNVSCERGKWKFSIYESIAFLHDDKKRLVLDKLRQHPELFKKTIDMENFSESLKE